MGTFGVKRASDESFCPSTVVRQQSPCEVVSCFGYGIAPRKLIGAKHTSVSTQA